MALAAATIPAVRAPIPAVTPATGSRIGAKLQMSSMARISAVAANQILMMLNSRMESASRMAPDEGQFATAF